MERDQSYDEAITPTPGKGHVVVLTNPESGDYHGTEGITAEKQDILELDPLDGPIRLEDWALGSGITYDGHSHSSPDDDPAAVHLNGESLLGKMPDGKLVFTAPVTEAVRFGPTPLAFVADGLCFELGAPSKDWLAVHAQPERTVEDFLATFAPLSTSGWQRGLQ